MFGALAGQPATWEPSAMQTETASTTTQGCLLARALFAAPAAALSALFGNHYQMPPTPISRGGRGRIPDEVDGLRARQSGGRRPGRARLQRRVQDHQTLARTLAGVLGEDPEAVLRHGCRQSAHPRHA